MTQDWSVMVLDLLIYSKLLTRWVKPIVHFSMCACVLCRTDCSHQAPLSMGFPRQEYWMSCHALLQRIFPTQGLNPCLLHLLHGQVDSLLLTPPGNSSGKNTGVGSQSLLQRIFPTQGLNPGLLHCRQILYCLSHV